jgi:hypothetical protein
MLMGRSSFGEDGFETFGMGIIFARFRQFGKVLWYIH